MITWAPQQAEILDVARRMRDEDRRELFATSWAVDPEALAQETSKAFRARGTIAAGMDRDEPIVIGALIESRPHVISLGMFATNDWHQISSPFSRLVKSELIPALIAAGAHRFEALSMTSHPGSPRFLEFLGLKPFATLRAYGRDREDFTLYSRVLDPPEMRRYGWSPRVGGAPTT